MNDFIASLGPISSAVWGWLIIAVFMHFLWMWQKKTGRAGFVDVAWSIGTGLMAMGFCVVGSGRVWACLGVSGRVWTCLGVILTQQLMRPLNLSCLNALKKTSNALAVHFKEKPMS